MILNEILIVASLIVAILLVYTFLKLGPDGVKEWAEAMETKEGKGILRGIIEAPIAIILIGLIILFVGFIFSSHADAGDYFNEAGVFIGLDYTKKSSPSCEANRHDDHGTSNLGAFVNFWRSDSESIELNGKYTHHSCVLGPDDRQYDAVGVEIKWIPWRRN